MINQSTPLNEIVRADPSSARVLFKYGLDYCCGGKQALGEACDALAVNPFEVLEELRLNDLPPTSGLNHFQFWDRDFLNLYIEKNHHRFVRETLPILNAKVQTVIDKHGSRFPELRAVQELIEELGNDLLLHLDDEEKGLFNSKLNLTQGQIEVEISKHVHDHALVGGKLMRLRTLTNNFTPPNGACTTHRMAYHTMQELVEDTMQHVYLENEVLFPMYQTSKKSTVSIIGS